MRSSGFRSRGKAFLRQKSSRPALHLALVAFVAASFCPRGLSGATGWRVAPCKYSVRDVAFVNLESHPWQLHLESGSGPTDEQNRMLQQTLEDSNISYLWSEDAALQRGRALPKMTLRMRDSGVPDSPIELNPEFTPETTLAEVARSLSNSPARDRILQRCVDSLCVVLLVESGDDARDRAAAQVVSEAIMKIKNSLWTLEKPTAKGAAEVVVPDAQAEQWLLHSLGIDRRQLPAVCIVFGRGVRLGDVMYSEEIAADRIAATAAICGRDCECDLDPEWLYGTSMMHVWTTGLERAAESSLTFDPNSALVIAEVSQILSKNARRGSGVPPELDLGSGLVIHDLGPRRQPVETDARDPAENKVDQQTGETAPIPVPVRPAAEPPNLPRTEQADQSTALIPWTTLGTLAALLLFVAAALIFFRKNA